MLKIMSKITLPLVLFAAITSTQAKESQINCPSLNKINEMASKHLYPVQKGSDGYTLSTVIPFIDHGHLWVLVTHVEGDSLTEARGAAKATIKQVNFKYSEFADDQKLGFVCGYGPGFVGLVGGWNLR